MYYNAGIQTPGIMKKWEVKDLYDHFSEYIENSGWKGMVPNLSDLKHNIEAAKNIPNIVEYENP